MSIYYGDFGCLEDVVSQFDIQISDLDGAEILFAYYMYEDYSGTAFVLFRRDGKLYEVNGGHCSCYGLEGQWEPEETFVEAILERKLVCYNDEMDKQLFEFLCSMK